MAMREYMDERGTRWTVWSVSSEALHPATRSEDFLRQFASGWLCFESAEGEKRRLIEYPEGWEFLSGEELGRLLDRAIPRVGSPAGNATVAKPDNSPTRAASPASDTEQAADAALASAELRERRRTDLAPPPDHPLRRREDRQR